jgi:3D (Asp-Asp-Asp) domain-containing protein
LGKTTVKDKDFRGTFLNPVSVLVMIVSAVIICVLIGAKANGQITLLDTAADKVKAEQGGEWETVRMRVTAYCPCRKCCGRHSDGRTACNYRIRQGDRFVAADKEYPFGTEMIIAGYNNEKPVKVLDRGGVIRGNRLDAFFNSHKEALKWGVKYLDVKIRRK